MAISRNSIIILGLVAAFILGTITANPVVGAVNPLQVFFEDVLTSLENIDGDLAAHDTNIDGDLAAHDTNIDGDLAAHENNIVLELGAHNLEMNSEHAGLSPTVFIKVVPGDFLVTASGIATITCTGVTVNGGADTITVGGSTVLTIADGATIIVGLGFDTVTWVSDGTDDTAKCTLVI